MKEEKLVPELRFPEFEGEWKKKELGNILDFKNGLNKGKKFFGKGTPIVNYMDVNRNKHLLKKDIKGLVSVNDSEKERFKVIKGDTFFTRTSETVEEIGLASVVIEDIEDCVYSGFILRGRKIVENIDMIFSGYLYNTESVRKEIIRKSSKTTRALTNGTLLSEVELKIPYLEEQEKIGNFFYKIDKKIELQEEVIENLEKQKKGLIQRIFNQEVGFKDENGEDYPEWEKIILENVLEERQEMLEKGKGAPHASLTKDGIELKTERYNRDFLVTTDNKKYKVTRVGDVCYNPANLKFGVITINEIGTVIFSPIYITFEVNNNVNFKYLSYYLMRWDFINKVRKYEEGTVYERMAVKPVDFLKYEIKIPSLQEQEKIADFLSSIDRKISLEKERIENYKQYKKGLMQRMFI